MATTKLEPTETRDGLTYVIGVRKDTTAGFPDTHDGGCSCGFRSKGWASHKLAAARMEGHAAEHRRDGPTTPELVDFLSDHGLATVPSDPSPFGGDDDVMEG